MSVVALAGASTLAAGQNVAPIASASVASEGKAAPRTEFISYDARKAAVDRDLDAATHYLPLQGSWRVRYIDDYKSSDATFAQRYYNASSWEALDVPSKVDRYESFAHQATKIVPPALPEAIPAVQYRAEIMVPLLWVDREMFVHVGGVGSAYTLYVNGRKVGYSNDNQTPSEFNISRYIDQDLNSICLEVYGYSSGNYLSDKQSTPGSLGSVYVYSQPRIRIADYVVQTLPDSAMVDAKLNLCVILENSYNVPDTIKVGYDIYTPEGKLKMYNLTDRIVPANSTDTVRFEDDIYGVMKEFPWSPSEPTLYDAMLYVRRGARIDEYIPFRVGFKESEFIDGQFYLNRAPMALSVVACNALEDARSTEAMLRKIKTYGKNAVVPDYPQPMFFYELCDKVGLFVIDQANINAWYSTDDRNVGGSIVNDPQWLGVMKERVRSMFERTKNSTSVIARSMGGYSGNGYNMYHSYLELKSIDSLSMNVTYRDVQGEWNSDIAFPEVISVERLFSSPAPNPRARR